MSRDSLMPSSTSVERMRLIGAIDRALERPIMVIVAPSGYGKSTLLRQWEQGREAKVVHLDCRESDNIPARFVFRLLAAAAAINLAVSPESQGPSGVLAALLEAVAAAPDTITFVLDDIGIIVNQEVQDLISMLLDDLPPNARFIGSGRRLPRIHLFRRLLDEDLSLLTHEDLAFTDEEASDFLRQRGYDDGDVVGDRIRARASGWIVGLKLLALPERRSGVQVDELADLTIEESLDRYLEEELLLPLTPEVQSALLMSSELPFLSPALWEHLFPSLAATETLAMLAAERALLTAHPSVQGELRYSVHQLLAESLGRIARARVPRVERDRVAGRTAEWFLARGDAEQALDIAIRGEIWDVAVPIMEVVGAGFADRDQSRTMLHWISRLPVPVILANDLLAYWMIFAAYSVGQIAQANELLSRAEPRWHESQAPVVRGRLHACRGMRAALHNDVELVASESRITLDLIPDYCHIERLHAMSGLIEAAVDAGRFDDVARLLEDAREVRAKLPLDQSWWPLHVALVWPHVLAMQGQLVAAFHLYEELLANLRGDLRRHDGKIASRMAIIALEWNQLDEALRLIEQIDFVMEDRFAANYWYPEAWLIRARILMALRREDEARAEIDRAVDFASERGMVRVLSLAQTMQAVWDLKPSATLRRAIDVRLRAAADLTLRQYWGEIDPLFADILRHLRRHEHTAALALIERGIKAARERNRVDIEVHAQVLAAACHSMSDGERGLLRAARALGRAIALGRDGGFIRSFLVPGIDLRSVLDRVQHDPADLAYVSSIRAAMDDAYGGNAQQRLYLSTREREVMRMLEAGASNQQIAETLFISVNTVKKHLVRINRKLGTPNRTAAVLRAKQERFLQHASLRPDHDPLRQELIRQDQ